MCVIHFGPHNTSSVNISVYQLLYMDKLFSLKLVQNQRKDVLVRQIELV